MFYFKIDNGICVDAVDAVDTLDQHDSSWITLHDIQSYAEAEKIADELSIAKKEQWVAVDNGTSCYLRFDCARVPKLGDKVSYAFNGDCYPDGEIVAITSKYQVTTSTGSKYRRKGITGRWAKTGGTWSLVKGHLETQNPSF